MATSIKITTLLMGLGLIAAGVACKKPEPYKAPEPPQAATPPVDTDKARREAEAEARRRADAERQKAEAAKAEAARLAQADREALTRAAEKALQDVHFAFDASDLSSEAKDRLQAIADFLKQFPKVRIQIEGNCDERGTVEYNLALGERRTSAAFDYLKSLGVDPQRMTTLSYGKEKPVCTESVEACWYRNRRDHFVMK